MTDSETPKTSETETEKPADPLGKVKGFVEEHPVAMVAGGIVLGALVAGALARGSGAIGGAVGGAVGDKATRKGTLARMSIPRRAVDLATLGVELAAAYVAGTAGEKAAAAEGTDEPAKPAKPGLPGLADKALRTLGPIITSRLPRKKAD